MKAFDDAFGLLRIIIINKNYLYTEIYKEKYICTGKIFFKRDYGYINTREINIS